MQADLDAVDECVRVHAEPQSHSFLFCLLSEPQPSPAQLIAIRLQRKAWSGWGEKKLDRATRSGGRFGLWREKAAVGGNHCRQETTAASARGSCILFLTQLSPTTAAPTTSTQGK